MNDAEVTQLIDSKVDQLMDHFDSVQILVSWPADNGTRSCYRGAGNWFARTGMARDFLERDEAEIFIIEENRQRSV